MTEAPQPSPNAHPYANALVAYLQAGWPAVLPVPAREKFPPPVGYTGAEGRDTDPLTATGWATGGYGDHAVALRMPDGVIGIDVDHYTKGSVEKRGADTLAEHETKWGPLPPTWTSTARGAGQPSRVHFFRVPPQRYASSIGADIDVLQRHHRYAVVWPSPHATGGTYAWYTPDGSVADTVPAPDDFPELPATWIVGLAEGASSAGPASADHASGHTLLGQLLDDWRPECADITSARLTAVEEMVKATAGGRHDVMVERTYPLIQLGAHGHPGVAAALGELRDLWSHVTAGEDRAQEFEDALLGAARKAATLVGHHQVPRDPCLMVGGMAVPAPMPGDSRSADEQVEDPDAQVVIEGIEPERWWAVREFIGVHAFDPVAGLDQTLAEAVLERTWPALRYAYDAGSWVLRLPERWETRGDLSDWAVATVAPLMPVGDATADKESDAFARHQRRTRLMTSAGASAVSKKAKALVAAGSHPATLRLGTLDADPELLWAGGYPWSLRASTDGPAIAQHVDPTTPHLHAAGVMPERRPTPLWDEFTAAVWPDEGVRRWALRVLSVALTGYPDRALPILLGGPGRGKTQVITLMMSLLGSYAHAANPKLLSASSNEHDAILYDLKGRRLSFIDEGPREAKAGQERLKHLSGGGEITGRLMGQNPVTFSPTHTLVLTANAEPMLTDPAVRSRVRLIPCEGDPEAVKYTRAALGHTRGSAWRGEAPGVLAMFMAEAAAWLADTHSATTDAAPAHIRYRAEELAAEQDPITQWLEECDDYQPGTLSRELYQAFRESCRRSGIRLDAVPSETAWGRELSQRGYPSRHSEHGKRRPLIVRGGGFLPGMPAPTTPSISIEPVVNDSGPADGLGGNPDGLLTGLEANPSGTFSQVNPCLSVTPDGSDGLSTSYAYEGTPLFPHIGHGPEEPVNPSGNTPKTGVDLRKRTFENPSGGPEPVRKPEKAPRKPQDPAKAEAARVKRAETTEAKRLAAVAEAAGPTVELPAVVTRDGQVRPCTLAQAAQLLDAITGAVTVDVEHTGYPIGHEHYALRTVQLGNEHFAVVLDAGDPSHEMLGGARLQTAPLLHAHSATADLVPLIHAGWLDESAWERMIDTAILAKLADPGSVGNDADLKNLARAVLGEAALSYDADKARAELFKAGKWLTKTEATTPLERSGWAQVDARSETMVRYAASDVLDDAALALALPQPPPEILHRERTVQRMTARMSDTGFRFDAAEIARLTEEHHAGKTRAAETVHGYGIANPGSAQQVGNAMVALGANLPRTATGKPSVAEGVIDPFAKAGGDLGALAQAVLDYRHHETALGLFLEPWGAVVRSGDGRARSTIYTLGADTGRMSSHRFNFQQVSREGGLRGCITADPGYLLASADFAGVELRGAAGLSGDRQLLQTILEADADPESENDLHWQVTRLAFGPQATKAQRYAVKRGVFGRIYGGGITAIAKGVGVDEATAKRIIEAMDTITPQLTEWSRMVSSGIESGRTKFQAYSGRVIHLPKDRPHAGGNYCIQGTCRELLVDALLRWQQTPWGHCTLLPVHDEIVVMVPEAEAQDATTALVECMTTELFGVPIIAEPSQPSYAWSDSV